jgi:hypothetical protein
VTNVLGTSRIGIVSEVLEDGTVGTFVIRTILEKMFERVYHRMDFGSLRPQGRKMAIRHSANVLARSGVVFP